MEQPEAPDRAAHAERRRRVRGAKAVLAAIDAGETVRLIVLAEDDEAAPSPGAATNAGPERREIDSLLAGVEAAAGDTRIEIRRVSRRALRRLAGPGDEVRVVALVGPDPRASLAETCARPGPVWLLAGPSYPGNAGLATRAAEVSGAAGVCIDATFDRDGRRACLRASMRSDRIMPVHFVPWRSAVDAAAGAGRRIIAIEDVGERLAWQADLRPPALFVVGGEAEGVPDALLARADLRVRIPTGGFVSSYNLQAAMAVVMGEWLRQSGEGR